MRIGYIGLGKMGKNMVLRLVEQGIEVVAWNRSVGALDEVVKAGSEGSVNFKDMLKQLPTPCVIWLMLPPGEVTQQIIDELYPLLAEGDLIIDGGDTFYQDSIRQSQQLAEKGIHFMDIGVSGGLEGARNGASLMVGGNLADYHKIQPLIIALSAPEAFGYFGRVGAGHFAKMVQVSIASTMMEAIAEGASILRESDFEFDLGQVLAVYNHRTSIQSRLVGWAQEALAEEPNLVDISAIIIPNQAVLHTIATADELNVEIPAISASAIVRTESENVPEQSPQGFRNKVVAIQQNKST